MDIAVIDVGTNTVLLLVARFDSLGDIRTLAYEQRVPRLGQHVDAQKAFHRESMERTLAVLGEYKAILSRFNLSRTVVCGTSAVRDAHNKQQLIDLVRRKTGFELEALSGDDEAFWTYRGAVSGLPSVRNATVADIGGGSTEISVGDRQSILDKVSLDIGSVRLTERYFKHDPPTQAELKAATRAVETELARHKHFDFTGSTLIGVAGTATSLAILDQGLREFTREAVTNYILSRRNVSALFETLRQMPSAHIGRMSAVLEGRDDIITAGALILDKLMSDLDFDQIIVSERGLRYGLAIREWERAKPRSSDSGFEICTTRV